MSIRLKFEDLSQLVRSFTLVVKHTCSDFIICSYFNNRVKVWVRASTLMA